MEDEKKNINPSGSSEHKKNRPYKKKGYFITPNSPEQPKSSAEGGASTPSQKSEKPSAEGTSQRHQGKNHHHNKNKNRNNPQNQKNDAPKTSEKNDTAPQTPPKDTPQKNGEKQQNKQQRPHQGNRNHHHNNRNRNSHRNSVNEQKPQVTEQVVTEAPVQTDIPETLISEFEATPIPEETVFDLYEEEVKSEEPKEEENVPLVEVVGIKFKSSGKTYYFDPNGKTYHRGGHAIVETARGLEYGDIAMSNTMVKETDTVPPIRPVVRLATPADTAHHEENKAKEEEAFKICNERIIAHGLDMKLIDAQYTFDNTKLLFYFTSAGRVDFRELVKDLASVFRTRIELRQIGIREEAKIMGGLGMCGRPLCCSLFLTDFGQVSIKMAKEQNLSLNSAKISGICGRLMCCLRYEYETYEYEIKRTPPVDSKVKTPDGIGTVTEINPLSGKIKVRLEQDTMPKTYHRDDVVVLQKKQQSQE